MLAPLPLRRLLCTRRPVHHDMTGMISLVTGAGSGVGRSVALAFAAAGSHVVLAGRRQEPLEATAVEVEAAGVSALVVPTDVADVSSVEELFSATEQRFGRLARAGVAALARFARHGGLQHRRIVHSPRTALRPARSRSGCALQ